jgi:pimeloyl-ACP methyl ester carboxylesterase
VPLFWLGLGLTCSVPAGVGVYLLALGVYLRIKYVKVVVRIFQEKPLFVAPRGEPTPDAEDVRFRSEDGLTLCGCYLKGRQPRRGVLLFGLEYGSNRWSCRPYVEHLLAAGFDVFAYEPRNQGDSAVLPGYEPLQWVTDYEVRDARAALAYLRGRPDADPRGVGLFGISKGGGAGLFLAAADPAVRCCITDGAFGTFTTLVPYMRKFFKLYNQRYGMQMILPSWYFALFGLIALRRSERLRRCRFPHLERALRRVRQPLLMIHGEADAYIRPNMARALFDCAASADKEFWLAPGSKHNQALHEHGDEYRSRVLRFFEKHLADGERTPLDGAAGAEPPLSREAPPSAAPRKEALPPVAAKQGG